jgi:hypothetical protein
MASQEVFLISDTSISHPNVTISNIEIGKMILFMEGFVIDTALDLNIGYYLIKLDDDVQGL